MIAVDTLTLYQSHKLVRAAEIITLSGRSAIVELADGSPRELTIGDDVWKRFEIGTGRAPEPGDFLVYYEQPRGGWYVSVSPGDVFAAGNTKVELDQSAELNP
jgi:hypothetical protein